MTTTTEEPKTKKSPKKKGTEGEKVRESQQKIFEVDCRLITGSLGNNHRDAFKPELARAGYGLFEKLEGHSEMPTLWELGSSDDQAKQAEFLRLMELYEAKNPADPSIVDLANSIHSNPMGQINPIQVREGGAKKSGDRSYTLVAGHRRAVATLYLWCRGLRKTPMIKATFFKGNHLDALVVQKDENTLRKAVDAIIVAKGFQRSMNEGATIEQVAEANGFSEQTVKNYLTFLELDPKEQEKLRIGKLSQKDAIAIAEDRRKGGEGKTKDGMTAEEVVTARPKGTGKGKRTGKWSQKKIAEAIKNPPTDWAVPADSIKFVLGVIMAKHDKNGNPIGTKTNEPDHGTGDFEAVLPPEVAGTGLLDEEDVEFEVDAEGNFVLTGNQDN